jgi:hypothetical protein
MRRQRQRGSTMLEFTLVGIPMIFVLLSVFEISRIVWSYHTLAAAVAEGARFSIVHGKNCSKAPNDCAATVGDIAGRVKSRGIGLIPSDTTLTFTWKTGTMSCAMPSCLTNTTVWPPAGANEPGTEIEVKAVYAMKSPMSMFWPSAGTVNPLGNLKLGASSREAIQF